MLAKASPSLMDAVILFCCGGFTEQDKMEEVRESLRSPGADGGRGTETQGHDQLCLWWGATKACGGGGVRAARTINILPVGFV